MGLRLGGQSSGPGVEGLGFGGVPRDAGALREEEGRVVPRTRVARAGDARRVVREHLVAPDRARDAHVLGGVGPARGAP